MCGGDCPSEGPLADGELVSAGSLAGARAKVVEERLDVVGRDDRVAVDADKEAARGRFQTAVKCMSGAPARVAEEANTLVLHRPALDDAPRIVGGVTIDDDHLDWRVGHLRAHRREGGI